jgi:hypothetical protein
VKLIYLSININNINIDIDIIKFTIDKIYKVSIILLEIKLGSLIYLKPYWNMIIAKGVLMNMCPEILSEQNRAKIKADMDAIRLEEEATKGESLLDKNLALLGDLMISSGEKLRSRYQSSQEKPSVKLANKTA